MAFTEVFAFVVLQPGPVLAGIVGVKMPRYTVFGETTAIAERMEALGKGWATLNLHNQINLSI